MPSGLLKPNILNPLIFSKKTSSTTITIVNNQIFKIFLKFFSLFINKGIALKSNINLIKKN